MLNLKVDDLYNFLIKEQFPVQIKKETQQIYMVFKIENREFPVFIRVFPGGDLLQLISFIPCNLKAAFFGELARLLHMLNKELDIPGFGMDENANLIFYRAMIPAIEKQVNEEHVKRYIHSIEQILKNFAALIAMVAFGATSFEEVRKKMKPHQPQKP
jgi:hypothetical protein